MSKPVVFVIGASGEIGKATVTALSKHFGGQLQIKAGVRFPEKVAAFNSLNGVEVVQADMGKPDSLVEVFKNVHSLYIVTPGAEDRADLTINAAQAGKAAGVKHIMVVSTPMAQFPETIFGKQFIAIEEGIAKLGIPYTVLRLPIFMENNLLHTHSIKKQSSFHTAVELNRPFDEVSVIDAGLAAACILASPKKHVCKTYTIISDRHTYEDVENAYSIALGREVKYVPITYKEAMSLMEGVGFPEWQAKGFIEIPQRINNGSFDTSDNYANIFEDITGKKPTKFTLWLSKFKNEFM